MKPLLEKEGLEVEIDEFEPLRANMIVTYKGKKSSPKFVFTGHLDTVPLGEVKWDHDPFGCEVVDGKVYGRGVSDMKSGDAAALYTMILLKRSGFVPENDIIFVATAGEETLSMGALAFMKKEGMKEAGALVVCEPSCLDVCIAHKGAIWVNVKFYGKTAHGSMPDLGVNALVHMSRFIAIASSQPFDCKPDPVMGMPTVSINEGKGGAAPNVVPDYAECSLDFRTIRGQTWEDVKRFLDKALAEAAKGEEDFRYEYEKPEVILAPVYCPEEAHIKDDFDAAAGKKLDRIMLRFFTDASVLVDRPDLPVIIFGPGESYEAHQPNEFMYLDKYYESIPIYYRLMKNYKVD